jgi:hypothetical protein
MYVVMDRYLIPNATATQQRVVNFNIPGRTDTKPVNVPVQKPKPLKKDSSDYWKKKYDSIQTITTPSDTTAAADSVRAEYIYPYQIEIDDSLTTNWATIFPLNPKGTRVRIDSTNYKPIKLSFAYIDTTINVTSGINLRTYATVGGGAVIGASVGGVPGAGIGALVGLLVEELL